MKILFLDIDGVLNSYRSCFATGNFPHKPSELEHFDMIAVGLIRKVCEETNTKIVLSSTWRMNKNWVELKDTLNLPIIDRTPVHYSSIRDGQRGEEVREWLTQHPEVKQYAIVDDGNDFLLEQQPYFVKTDFAEGLSYKNYLQLKEILDGKN
jgi:hypothetical protein